MKNNKNDIDKLKIKIGNLRHFLTENQIRKHLKQYENVEDVKIIDHNAKQTGYKNKTNNGFVTFKDAVTVKKF